MIEQRKPQLFFPILMAVFVILLAIWSFFALTTGNLSWFRSLPERSYMPNRIVVNYYGTSTELEADSNKFHEITAALNQSLNSFRGRIPIGLSRDTLHDYYEKEYVLEIFFSSDIGSVIGLGVPINHLLIPIDGRHSGNHYVFTGNDDKWLASALLMDDSQPLITALNNLEYPAKNR